MKSNVLALKADIFSDPQRHDFMQAFTRLIYSGQGSSGLFAKQSGLKESDALKIFLGVPADALCISKRRAHEAIFFLVTGGKPPESGGLWTESPRWMPSNPRFNVRVPLAERKLDIEFIDSFGIRRTVWEREILMTSLAGLIAKMESGSDMTDINIRVFVALAMFGFADPDQFFV